MKKIVFTLVMFSIATIGYAQTVIKEVGNKVGIGTTAPSAKLQVVHETNLGEVSEHGITVNRSTQTNTNVTSYDKGIYSKMSRFSIPSGITDLGYKIGVDATSFSTSNIFAGTLNGNYGIWARAGIHVATPGATIKRAIAVNAEILDNVTGTTIENAYGVYISTNSYNQSNVINRYDLYAATAAAKNYFAGKVGIGTTTPRSRLDIGSNVGANKGLRVGDYIEINERETINNAAVIGFNASIEASDVSKFKPAWVGASTSSGMILTTTSGGVSDLNFYGRKWGTDATPRSLGEFTHVLHLGTNGKVGVGTINTGTHRLAVEGSIGAREIKVEAFPNWSDFVFEKEYQLPPLAEVENHIKEKGHLKDIPSATEVKKDGFFLGEMDAKLLQKIEELTLYTIEQEKKINKTENINKKLLSVIEKLEKRITKLEENK